MNDHPDPLTVLDQIEESLRQSLERAPEPAASDEAPTPAALSLDGGLDRLQACLERAEEVAAGVEEALAAEQAAWQECLQRLRAVRERLAG